MENVSYCVTVGKNIRRKIGVLSYRCSDDTFTFEYDEECSGYPFGDIDCNNGRYFESSSMFGHFFIEDSWTRQTTVERYKISNPDSNAGQLRLIEILSQNDGSYEGMKFERLQNLKDKIYG